MLLLARQILAYDAEMSHNSAAVGLGLSSEMRRVVKATLEGGLGNGSWLDEVRSVCAFVRACACV